MLTKAYTRSVPLSSIIASSAREISDRLLTKQATIADVDYNRRNSPHLADVLSPSLATVSQTDDRVEILINYPLTIRFLDIQKMKYRKPKRYYEPIYNRLLFGYLYGRDYSLANLVNSAIGREYENYRQSLKSIGHITCYEI